MRSSDRTVLKRLGLPAALALLFLVLASGAVGGDVALVAVGALGLHVVEYLVGGELSRALPRRLGVVTAEMHVRLLLGQLLVIVFLLRVGALTPAEEVVVVLAVIAQQGLRTIHSLAALAHEEVRTASTQGRGLEVLGGPLQPAPRALGRHGHAVTVHSSAALAGALLWALVADSYALVVPGAVVMVVAALAVVLAALPHLVVLVRLPRGHERWRLVHGAAVRHEPVVLLYSAAAPTGLHQVEMWLETMDALGLPGLVVLRDPETFARLRACSTPVVCLPRPADVTRFTLPTARVVLFPANNAENVRLLRNPRLKSVLIGHGDSDKEAFANPFCRVYHEVWVAGEAGRRRFLDAEVGVDPEAVRVVGRPQVRRIARGQGRPPGRPYRVLYAPTWEGRGGNPYESSLVSSGREIVRALLGMEGIQVVFRPHPWTGLGTEAARRASADVVDMLAAAGPPHLALLGQGVDLVRCFNEADVLISDLSAVVSDFLASGKPYFVVNGSGEPPAEFRRRNYAARGAYLLGPGGTGLEQALADARGADSMRERRQETRELLLGPADADPLQAFVRAIEDLAAPARPRA